MKSEIKVGVFVFLGILSLIFLTLQVNSLQDLNKKGYEVYALINDASGLAKKAKVKMRGVDIGVVEDLSLDNNYVKLKLLINKNVKIPVGSEITLAQDNFLGGRYVKIIPSDSSSYYKAGEIIKKFLKTASMTDVMNNINGAVDEIRVLIRKLNNTLDNKTIANIKETVANIKDSSVKLKEILQATKEKLPKLLDNANDLVLEFKHTGKIINKKLPGIMDKTDSLLTKFNKTGDTINAKLSPLMDEYIKLGKNANKILNDNKDGIKQAIVSAKDFFKSGGESFKKIDKYLSSLTKSQILVDIQSNYMVKDDYFKTTAQIAYLPVPTKYYILGATSTKDFTNADYDKAHIKDKTYITAEYGKRYDNIMLRGGIIESTGGVGIDYFAYKDKLKLSGDFYDFNAVNDIRGSHPHVTFKGTYLYLKHIQLIGGVDNVLNKESRNLFLGVGVKFKDNDLKTILGGGASSFLK